GAATVPAAFAAFGLAVCVKQHFVVAPVISTGLLLAARRRGRLAPGHVARGLLSALAVVLAVGAAEEWATGGRRAGAICGAAGGVGRVNPSDWVRVQVVLSEALDRSVGLLALMTAAGLALVRARPGLGRRAFAAAGAVPVGLVVTLAALPLIGVKPWAGVPLDLGELVL